MKENERKWKKMKENERKMKEKWKKMKENERKWKRMCTFPKGILECRQEEYSRMYTFLWKKKVGNAENDKNGPFDKWSRPRMCGFLGARVPFQNVHYSLGELGSRPGGSPFSQGEEQTFSECALFLRKKGSRPGERPGRGLRGDWI